MTEAVYFGKPVLAVPIKGQSEQTVNAYFIKKQKNCQTAEELTIDAVKQFIQMTDKAKNTKTRNWSNAESYQIIEKTIDEMCRRV